MGPIGESIYLTLHEKDGTRHSFGAAAVATLTAPLNSGCTSNYRGEVFGEGYRNLGERFLVR